VVRRRAELAKLQGRVLESYRRARLGRAESIADGGLAGLIGSAAYGRVTQVVGSDPTYGPHLVAALQRFSGTPPSPADASGAAAIRCYPTPGRSVGQYAVNEMVRLCAAAGAMLAEKLA